MAKKQGGRGGRRRNQLDPVERLIKMKKIAKDADTCEMGGDITIRLVYEGAPGAKQNRWLVGRPEDKNSRKKR